MAKQSIIKEFFLFIKHEKKWWLVPLISVLLLVGALIVFAGQRCEQQVAHGSASRTACESSW